MMDTSSSSSKKGITPVIAIVLLILVTVGAVGVVYSQFQGLVGDDPSPDFLDSIDDVEIVSATRNGSGPGTIEITVQSTSENEYNLSQVMRAQYSVPGENSLPYSEADSFDAVSILAGSQECFTNNGIETLAPRGTASCDTGVEMPGPSEEITIVMYDDVNGEVVDEYTCSPSTSNSATC